MADAKDSKTLLAEAMYDDEEMKPLMQEWAEKKYPGTRARMETAGALAQVRQEIRTEREKDRAERAAEKAQDARDKAIASIKRDPGLMIREDEIPAIEKLMAERLIGTWEDAAFLYREKNKVAAPVQSRWSSSIEVPGVADTGDGSWLNKAFPKNGGRPNMDMVDKLTRQQVDNIRTDFARDEASAIRKWGA